MPAPVLDGDGTDAPPGATNAPPVAAAARIRADALASAQRLVEAAHRRAEELHNQAVRQAETMLRAARDQVALEQQQVAGELQALGDELAQLHHEGSALWERLDQTRVRLAALTPAPPAPQPALASLSTGMLMGELDLVLPGRADRLTVEVMIAVLREQPGVTVRPASRRNQGLVIPLVVDRPVPLIPILHEVPGVVAAVYSAPNGAAGSASDGSIVLEFGDR